MEKSVSLSFRWLNDACYEIKLPTGKVILVDPYIDQSPNKLLGSDAVESADYVLISHTHFDHVLGLPDIWNRFHSQIFCGAQSSIELARYFDLPGWSINPMMPGEAVETPDFCLHAFRGKHTKLPEEIDRPSQWQNNVLREGMPTSADKLNILGSYEYIIWKIVLPDHRSILIWGGAATEAAIAKAAAFHPDLTIAQVPREDPEIIGRLFGTIGGQFIFPHHHEYYLNQGDAGLAVLKAVKETTERISPATQLIFPEKGRWYKMYSMLEEESQ